MRAPVAVVVLTAEPLPRRPTRAQAIHLRMPVPEIPHPMRAVVATRANALTVFKLAGCRARIPVARGISASRVAASSWTADTFEYMPALPRLMITFAISRGGGSF
jgi:hypothetical protein